MQPVRLVLLLLTGPREGENDFLDFASIEEAVTYGREIYGSSRFQLDGIENPQGQSLICYDHLRDLCRSAQPVPVRKYG